MTTSDLGPDPAAELAYVALIVDDPETRAAIFEKAFGLPRSLAERCPSLPPRGAGRVARGDIRIIR